MKKTYDKAPVFWGIVWGQGICITFILLEFLLFVCGISERGRSIIDVCMRFIFGIIGILVIWKINGNKFNNLFTVKISTSTWLLCLPLFLWLGVELMYIPAAESITFAFFPYFLFVCVREIGTGFWEEAVSKGIVMSGMLRKWTGSVAGRIAIVFITGLLFGSSHILNVLVGNDIVYCLWNALYASAFGVFLAALYLQSGSLMLCMIMHTVWDIVINIRPNFCNNVQCSVLADIIPVVQDILQFGVFPIIAVLVCIKCSNISKTDTAKMKEEITR